jgi:diaminobutyrate-2-oxoglutarate transaminase
MQISEAIRLPEQPLKERHAAQSGLYTFNDNVLLARQKERESNARSYPRRIPIALKRAKGIYVEDTEGRVFIDCLAAAGTLVLGHNHRVVVEAIERALRSELPMQTLDLLTEVKDEFVTELLSMLPASFARDARIQFCGPTGTDAVEAALKLVKTATGRGNMLAFHGAYHGMSHGSLGLMGNLGPKRAYNGQFSSVQFLPYAYDYRCPFGLGGEAGERAGLAYVRTVLEDPESGVLPPAGMILEAVQGEGGVIPASTRWLIGIRELCTAANVPLIIDEIQTGLGRTGRHFAFEHAGITPDVLVLSKAIGGGLPLSVVVYHESLDAWQPGAHAGTFRGNQLAMATGVATLRFVRGEGLAEHAAAMGERLLAQLRDIQRRFPSLGDIRGRGLMLGVEIVDPSGKPDAQNHPPPHRELAAALQLACLRRGLILELGGRHGSTLRFLPPLIINAQEIDKVAAIVADAVRDCAAAFGVRNAH